MQEVQEEGKYAIDSPGNPAMAEVSPEEYTLGKSVHQYFSFTLTGADWQF